MMRFDIDAVEVVPTPPRKARRSRVPAPLAVEAASSDPWTARARPAFLYVMYAVILGALPMGLIAAVSPAVAAQIAAGIRAYLDAVPEPLWALFGTGYLGYTVVRSWDKAKGLG